VEETITVGISGQQGSSTFLCLLRPRPKKVGIYLRGTPLVQDPDSDRRIRIVEPDANKFILLKAKDNGQVTRFTFAFRFGNCPVK
jgi:hypothetical protein